jgi:hypothetical protein
MARNPKPVRDGAKLEQEPAIPSGDEVSSPVVGADVTTPPAKTEDAGEEAAGDWGVEKAQVASGILPPPAPPAPPVAQAAQNESGQPTDEEVESEIEDMDFEETLKTLKLAEKAPVKNRKEARLKEQALALLRKHLHDVQQGVPAPAFDADSQALMAKAHNKALSKERYEIAKRANPLLVQLLGEHIKSEQAEQSEQSE